MKKIILLILLSFGTIAYAEQTDMYSMNDMSSEETLAENEGEGIGEAIDISFLNSKLTIENAPANTNVEIFSMIGVKVFHDIITEPKQFFLVDLKKGYYIVKVGNATKKISVK